MMRYILKPNKYIFKVKSETALNRSDEADILKKECEQISD